MANVLIVSGEWTPRALIRAQLEADGHEVTGRPTLDEGLLELRVHPSEYDAVVFDTQGQEMPPRYLRRLATAGPPVLILTGPYDLAGVDLPGLGFRHVLVRPVFVGEVVRAVERVLRAGGAWATRPRAGQPPDRGDGDQP